MGIHARLTDVTREETTMEKKRLILGIDLGTTLSRACVRCSTKKEYVFFKPENEESIHVPSVFAWDRNKKAVVVGGDALRFRDAVRYVKRRMKESFAVGDDPPTYIESSGQKFLPYEISGHILRYLKEAAEKRFASNGSEDLREQFEWHGEIDAAVITVPAYFGPTERHATRAAGKFAGFETVELLDEPVAAALGMNLHASLRSEIVLVIDFGGGTCDIALLKTAEGAQGAGFRELGRIGDNWLGGIDFDRKIAEETLISGLTGNCPEYSPKELDEIREDPELSQSAERAKLKLSQCMKDGQDETPVRVEFAETGKKHIFQSDFTARWLRENTDDLVDYCARLCDFLLSNIDRKEAGLGGRGHGIQWADIDQIRMVGGTGQIPHLRERIARRWGKGRPPDMAERPQRVVAEGAAVYAEMLANGQRLPGVAKPRCPYDIGIMYLPRAGLWDRMTRSFLRPPAKQQQRRLKFYPVIRSNTLLSNEEKRKGHYTAPIVDPTKSALQIVICQRFISREPKPADSSSDYSQNGHIGKLDYKIRPLRRLVLENLSEMDRRSQDRHVTIDLEYDVEHTLHFAASYQGRERKAVIRGDDFSQFFDFDPAQSIELND